ncbi:TPA: McrB family protein [Methanosarcina acetivorans]|uniref:AAA+ ATPase domain-containing protein n=2 Tax=Methanosarcina acetivorans TaxID=2214 RepID=Q8TP08_METAC|nr:McrB family protein [Methanosarcina acetivorans]AAM05517.1 hypothetical protein (multi-domain) [Methanosarcina acetivorans C2A]HIH93664.1 McrB family protein [Methanosarcina acetivorans]
MREDEIKKGIQLVCDTSKEISKLYEDKNALIEKLNSLSNEDLAPLDYEYRSKSGPVTDLRKDVLKYLLDGNKLDEQTFDEFILKHRTGNEGKFVAYQKPFSIFHPFITSYGHKSVREFIEQFINEIIERLQLKGKVNQKFVDFQGARYSGTDRLWLAIYNSKHKSQSTAIQLFVNFLDGKIEYGVYHHPNNYIKGPEERDSSNFDFEALISLFEENKELVLKDGPEENILTVPSAGENNQDILTIPLEGKKLYKMSHGEFKAKKYASILNTFKQNNWAVLHETTKKGQAERFKNGLHVGDYLYITVGGDELFAIAKVKSDSWEYVPEYIINEKNWLYREVEYIKTAIKTNPYELKEQRKFFYPSANSTLFEITPENLNEANENLFKPYFGVEFVSDNKDPPEINVKFPKFPCNIILYGPPGTGKTYNTIDLSVEIITGNKASHQENKKVFDVLREEGQIEFITFHQNYSYEDFMIGIRPDLDEASTLKFRRKEGIFYRICKRAKQNYLQSLDQPEVPLERYVLIIDEINRANISKVFGELITLLEEDKRLGAKNELRLSIPGEETGFGIPPNVYVIGTMNTADKSIAMIDIALRRRFEFQGYFPDYSKVDGLSGEILRYINNEIYNRKKSADYLIGHGYFMNGDEPPETSKVLQNKVIPLLMEYFSGKTEIVEEIFKGSKWFVKYDTEKYGWEIKPQIKQ